MRLDERHILVIGASKGIGHACARKAADLGARVTAVARNEDRLQASMVELVGPTRVEPIAGDISSASFRRQLAERIDPIDGLVYSPNLVLPYPSKYLDVEMMMPVLQVNLLGAVELNTELFKSRRIPDGSSLVYISSVASQHPFEGGASYCMSKAALESYVRSIALEHGRRGVRANCIAPAMVRTEMFEETVGSWGDDVMAEYENSYLLGFGDPADVAELAAFLLSSASRWITGETYRMDGGSTNSRVNRVNRS